MKGHTVAYDAAKKLVLLPGGREGKSKVLILRPKNSNQPDNEDTRATRTVMDTGTCRPPTRSTVLRFSLACALNSPLR